VGAGTRRRRRHHTEGMKPARPGPFGPGRWLKERREWRTPSRQQKDRVALVVDIYGNRHRVQFNLPVHTDLRVSDTILRRIGPEWLGTLKCTQTMCNAGKLLSSFLRRCVTWTLHGSLTGDTPTTYSACFRKSTFSTCSCDCSISDFVPI
jgi:hypothetical protein